MTMLGRTHTAESREKMRQSALRRYANPDERALSAASARRNWKDPGYRANNPGSTGYKHTAKARRKISAALSGRVVSDAARKKMSESARRRNSKLLTAETRTKMSAARKPRPRRR